MRMTRWMRGAFLALAAAVPAHLFAQGVTTGAISGVVTGDQGHPLTGVQVQVRNVGTGATSGALTHADGQYFVQGLEVGGPYTVTARRIGFAPQSKANLRVSLGQNTRADFSLAVRAAELSAIEVTTTSSSALISSSHKGASTTITDSTITRLPTLNRNFTDFVALTPQISTKGPGNSGGGQNNRFNAIQIDGSVANDLFGLGSSGQPGGQASAKQVPLEAVKEYQVLLSPFDVRQGNFTGALINAVTKSGTNEFHGSAFGVTRNEKLERDVAYLRDAPFKQSQYGFSLGGPIIKDRLHFFFAPEFQQRSEPASGPYVGQPANKIPALPIAQADIDRFCSILSTQYAYPACGSSALVSNDNPLTNFFGRLDLSGLPFNSRLVTRYNYVGAEQETFSRSQTSFRLNTNGYNFRSTTSSGLAQLFSNFANGASNEVLIGLTTIRDKRKTPLNAPQVTVSRVTNPTGGTVALVDGTESSSQGNELDQDIFEITDNVTVPLGGHRLTFGTKNEFFKVRNLFSQNSLGNYTFGTLDSLALGKPNAVTLGLKLDNSDGAARFNARTLGFYVEDEWQATPGLSFVAGLRLDLPGLTSQPLANPLLLSALGIDNTQVPQNVKQWSPRVGFNWDVTGDQTNQLRGGVGVFVGRPAYVWLSNVFGNSGVSGYANVSCRTPATSPAFPGATGPVPTNCAGTALTPAVTLNVVDPNLKFPQTLRGSLAYDRTLPGDVVATVEGIYTRGLQNFFYRNVGLVDNPIGQDRNGRQLYGEIVKNTNGTLSNNVTPTYKTNPATKAPLSDVILLTDENKDYAYSLTGQLQKRFTSHFQGSFAYTYGHSYDVQSLTSSVAYSNWQFGRSYAGREDSQELGISKFDSPHRFIAGASYSFPSKTDISANFSAESGVPFEFDYSGDANGDGSLNNDLLYVPTDAHNPSEILFQTNGSTTVAQQQDAFESFIQSNECLASQRGQIMKRNTCRTPWSKVMNVNVRQSLPTLHGQNFILQLDVFNFLNLLNKNWGAQDFGSTNSQNILTRRAFVTGGTGLANAQGVYNFNPTFTQFNTTNASSNYQLQLQLKYTF